MPHPVIEAAQRFRAGLLARERTNANALVRAYGRAYASMGDNISALEAEVRNLQDPDRATITRLASLRSLQRQAEAEINKYAVYADQQIVDSALAEIPLALNDGRATVAAYFRSREALQALQARWDMLPAASVETMLGFVTADSPLRDTLVNRLGPTVAQRMADRLVDQIALGMNPKRIREFVREEAGVGLTWSLTTARTAQLYSYREATRAGYVANRDIVSGWRWLAALDDRTCLSCWAQHGSLHDVGDTLNGHHNCRCVQIPEIPLAKKLGIELPDPTPGEQIFDGLSEAQQRGHMGPAMFDAWKAGEFQFSELTKPYEDRVYGTMLREASLVGLLGDRAKKYYRNP